MPKTAQLRDMLADVGLKKVEGLGWAELTADQVEGLVGFNAGPGVGIPYHDFDGKPTGFWRVRLAYPSSGMKYAQAAGSGVHLYLPPGFGLNWRAIAEGGGVPCIVITEGEKKAAALCALGFPAVGIGGKDCWSAPDASPLRPLDDLVTLAKSVGRWVVCFDSDRLTNPAIMKSENRLVASMRALGVEVGATNLPPSADGKVGIDDYVKGLPKKQAAEKVAALLSATFDPEAAWVREWGVDKIFVTNTGLDPYVLDGGAERRLGQFDLLYVAKRARLSAATGRPIEVSEAHAWRTSAFKKTIERVVFVPPPTIVPANHLNRYISPSAPPGYRAASLAPLHDFTRSILTEDEISWLYSWVSYAAATGFKPEWGPYVWSTKTGVGKTLLGIALGACFTPHFSVVETSSIRRSFGQAWFKDSRFLLLDEGGADERSGREMEGFMKNLSSAGKITVEEKYKPAVSIENHCLIYMATNHMLTKHIPEDDRRTMVLNPTRPTTEAIAKKLDAWLRVRPGDRASPLRPEATWALWEFFRGYNRRSDFNPSFAPMTAAKSAAIREGSSSLEAEIRSLMDDGQFFGRQVSEVVASGHLARIASFEIGRHVDPVTVGRALSARGAIMYPGNTQGIVNFDGKTAKLRAVRNAGHWATRGAAEWAAEYKKNSFVI